MKTQLRGIAVRRATVDDLPAIQSFIRETYGAAARFKGEARWRWQFMDNPFRPAGDSGPTVWIADVGGRVVGQIAVQDGAIRLDGARIDAGWIVDVMAHPAFRGLGLGHRIHEEVLRDRALLATLTMAPATRRIAERAGCVTLGPTKQFFRLRDVSGPTVARFLAGKAARRSRLRAPVRLFNASRIGPALLAGALRGYSALRRPVDGDARGLDAHEIERFPDSVDALWERAGEAVTASFDRSARFLNWRFCDAPGLTYRRFLLCSGHEIRGYLITRVGDPAEPPLGVIADTLAAPDDAVALDALTGLAREILSPETDYLEAAASTPSYCAALERAGFRALRTMRPTVVCSDPDMKARIAACADSWHFTKGDHDWDQVHPVPCPADSASQRKHSQTVSP